MGKWDWVAPVAKYAGIAAAPFTGGASLIAGNAISNIAGRMSGAAKGSADERAQRNTFNVARNRDALSQFGTQQQALLQALMAQDRGATDRYSTRQGATTSALANQSQEAIQRARLGLEAPTARARQSVMGSLMQNLQPVNVQASGKVSPHVPRISGGLTPAALDPLTRQHGGALMRAALEAQLTGSDIPAATNFMGGVLDAPESTDFRSGILKPPELEGYRQAGRGESIMSGGSLAAGIAGDLLGAIMGSSGSHQSGGGDYSGGFVGPTQDLDPDWFTGPINNEDFMADYG